VSVTLAIECSQRSGGIAMRGPSGTIVTASLESVSGVEDRLLLEVDRLFGDAALTPDTLSLVGISIGPGGFTGLRVAVATAKMLAMTTGCDVVAVPTALVVAGSRPGPPATTGVLLASRNGTAWLTCVSADLQQIGTPGLVDATTVASAVAQCDVCVADSHLPPDLTRAIQDAGLPVEAPALDPVACLHLAERAREQGDTADIHRLEPLYPRIPEAVRLFEAR
jgi:tRNA threonylcarbamoyl adenosine modification protein YeaZ